MSDAPRARVIATTPRAIAAVCLLVGLAAAAHSLYLFPHYGQGRYSVSTAPVDEVTGDQELVAFGDLPPSAREAVETDRSGGAATLYAGDHGASIAALDGPIVVRYEGTLYRVDLHQEDRTPMGATLVREALSLVGGVLVAVGILVGYAGRFRAASPLRAGAIPVVILGVTVVSLYPDAVDPATLGVGDAVGPLVALVLLVPLASEAARSRARGSDPPVVALGLVGAFLVGAFAGFVVDLPAALYPAGGLAATVSYLLAPENT